TWIKNAMPLTESYQSSFEIKYSTIFAAIQNKVSFEKFFFSIDNGYNWTSAVAGLPDSEIKDIKIFNEHIFVSTIPSGLYRRKLAELSGIVYNGNGALEAVQMKNAAYQWYFNDSPIQ